MSKYLTIVRSAALPISDDYLKRAVSNNRQYTGVAAAHDGQIKVAALAKAPTVDGIKAILDQFMDSTVVFSLGDVKNLPAEDMMPFTILKDKATNQPLVVVCLDGAFDRHKTANTAHSGEYHVAYGLIAKKVQRWFESGGIENVKKELDDELNHTDFQNMWSNKGCATFLFADGTAKTISNFDEGRNFSWGFASDPYGYKEEQPKVKEEVKPKENSLLSMLTDKITGKSDKVEKVEHIPETPPKTDTAVHSVSGLPAGAVIERPERGMDRKPLKIWYENRLGHAPHGFRSEPALVKLADGAYRLADSKSLSGLAELTTEPVKEIPPQQSQTAKDVTPKHVSTENKEIKTVRTSQLPILDPATVDRWQTVLKKEEFKGFFNESMKQIIDPKSVKTSLEQALPDVAERMGWGSMEVFAGMSSAQFELLSLSILQSGNPKQVMKKLLIDLRNWGLKQKLANPNAKWTPEKVAL